MADDTVKLGYSSMKNITFNGQLDTQISVADWREMSQDEQDAIVEEMAAALVDVWVIEP